MMPMGPAARFLLPVQQCEFQLTKVLEQLQKVPYCYSLYFTNSAAENLSKCLVESTGGKMSRAFIVSSGRTTSFFA